MSGPGSVGARWRQHHHYAYSVNTVTITDPAGKWKKQIQDVFGNIKTVNEPDPGGGANLATNYTYDAMNRLTQVSMLRGSTTQIRTFTYDPTTQRLSSQTHPESGTTSYTYNRDGTLATRTDAKGQIAQYTYDSYQRVTTVQRFPTPGSEDTCQGWNLTYDVNPPYPQFTGTNLAGRLSQFQWRGPCTKGAGFQYGYTKAGQIAEKSAQGLLNYTYDNEGKVASYATPSWNVYNYGFDPLDRPISMTDNSLTVWVQAHNANDRSHQ